MAEHQIFEHRHLILRIQIESLLLEAAVEPELPRPEAATAVRYVAGMTVAEGTIVRVAAVAEGKRGSHTLRFVAGE